ncbi:unnamed protein product [Prunus armeniaca]|uniref:Uncharacterized protein n=1 Tax=Prunus armeniaca TaxID=36596 RepID=A0A6J5UXU6_PRUAR|nr:unnamed protein product [Prunus armeniaca]
MGAWEDDLLVSMCLSALLSPLPSPSPSTRLLGFQTMVVLVLVLLDPLTRKTNIQKVGGSTHPGVNQSITKSRQNHVTRVPAPCHLESEAKQT